MAQKEVPFGEIDHVHDWPRIRGPVGKPDPEHPKRPITGFDCTRSEVSGRRLWRLFADRFGSAEDYFADHFIANYCPLVWMKDTGANLTPDKLPAASLVPVEDACLIEVGAYAEGKLKAAAESLDYSATTGRTLHPSPASPAANRDFAGTTWRQFAAVGGVWGVE